MSKNIRTQAYSHRTMDCVGAHGNHLRNNMLRRHDKKAVRRRWFHGTILPSMNCTVHLLRPHVRLDALEKAKGIGRGGKKGARTKKERRRREDERRGGTKRERESHIRGGHRASKRQLMYRGHNGGRMVHCQGRASSECPRSVSRSPLHLDRYSRLACTKGA